MRRLGQSNLHCQHHENNDFTIIKLAGSCLVKGGRGIPFEYCKFTKNLEPNRTMSGPGLHAIGPTFHRNWLATTAPQLLDQTYYNWQGNLETVGLLEYSVVAVTRWTVPSGYQKQTGDGYDSELRVTVEG